MDGRRDSVGELSNGKQVEEHEGDRSASAVYATPLPPTMSALPSQRDGPLSMASTSFSRASGSCPAVYAGDAEERTRTGSVDVRRASSAGTTPSVAHATTTPSALPVTSSSLPPSAGGLPRGLLGSWGLGGFPAGYSSGHRGWAAAENLNVAISALETAYAALAAAIPASISLPTSRDLQTSASPTFATPAPDAAVSSPAAPRLPAVWASKVARLECQRILLLHHAYGDDKWCSAGEW